MSDHGPEDEEPGIASKAGLGLLGILVWCSTGGLMLAHFASVFMGAATIIFGVIGFFIAPVGLVNGLVFLVTGDSLQQYF